MPLISSSNFLRCVLWADAISCLTCGLLQVVLPVSLGKWLGLSPILLADTGTFLLLYGAFVAFLASRNRVSSVIIRLLIAGNVAWGAACVAGVIGVGMAPAALGKAYLAVQALTVVVLAELQYLGLRQGTNAFNSAAAGSPPAHTASSAESARSGSISR
jgi:hypothetical protein